MPPTRSPSPSAMPTTGIGRAAADEALSCDSDVGAGAQGPRMIGKLKGRIDSYGTDWVIIDVGGVCYHVICSRETLAALPRAGEFGELHTEMLVSQDMIRLVGFATEAERDWFRLLQTVQGVGTKVALAILSTLGTSDLATAIAFGTRRWSAAAPASGRSLRSGSSSELKDKAPAFGSPIQLSPTVRRELDAPPPAARRCGLGAGQSRLRPGPGRRGGRPALQEGGR